MYRERRFRLSDFPLFQTPESQNITAEVSVRSSFGRTRCGHDSAHGHHQRRTHAGRSGCLLVPVGTRRGEADRADGCRVRFGSCFLASGTVPDFVILASRRFSNPRQRMTAKPCPAGRGTGLRVSFDDQDECLLGVREKTTVVEFRNGNLDLDQNEEVDVHREAEASAVIRWHGHLTGEPRIVLSVGSRKKSIGGLQSPSAGVRFLIPEPMFESARGRNPGVTGLGCDPCRCERSWFACSPRAGRRRMIGCVRHHPPPLI